MEFFTAAAHNLQETGQRAGVQRMVAVSIIGCDRFTAGYMAAWPPTSGPCSRGRSRCACCALLTERREDLVAERDRSSNRLRPLERASTYSPPTSVL